MIEQKKAIQADKQYKEINFEVHYIRHLTDTTYVVRFDRNEMHFIPGQHLSVGLANDPQAREYSIYNSNNDNFLEILVKEVDDGIVSKRLKKVKPGDQLKVTGPMGFFKLDAKTINSRKHLFVATGTGISPFHAFVKSYPQLDYQLIHGVRKSEEAYERSEYKNSNYTLCSSRDKKGDYNGRTTDFLRSQKIDPSTLVYLCGNCDMIFEVYDILTEKGIPTENIHTEVYF
ncbi:MAG: FAD-binding oxidoreductase [Prolixibacteraceae bacterium]|nr:FAD-binding oxidoreductase [Prolixibacteraceae bacterium]